MLHLGFSIIEKFIKMNRLLPIITRNCSSKSGCLKSSCKPGGGAGNKKRHNYPENLESAVNQQILNELNASMTYLSMCCFYGRNEITLPGCQSLFKYMYFEEQEHAMELMDYQLLRGGTVKLFPLVAPENQDWGCITVSLGVAMELEKHVKEKLEELLGVAEDSNDIHLIDLLSTKFIPEQNESIDRFARYLTQAEKVVDSGPVGEFLLDRELYRMYSNNKKPYQTPVKIHKN